VRASAYQMFVKAVTAQLKQEENTQHSAYPSSVGAAAAAVRTSQADKMKVIGERWRKMTPGERAVYEPSPQQIKEMQLAQVSFFFTFSFIFITLLYFEFIHSLHCLVCLFLICCLFVTREMQERVFSFLISNF
jgi:Flp pilus assembly protein TadB